MARVAPVAAAALLLAGIAGLLLWQRNAVAPGPDGQATSTDAEPVESVIPGNRPDAEIALRPESGCTDIADDDRSVEEIRVELQRVEAEAVRNLRVSADAEHLLAAAIIRLPDDPLTALDFLSQAYLRDDRHPLVVAQLLDTCIELEVSCTLDTAALEDQLIRLEGNNAVTWALVARSRSQRGNDAGALAALRQAASAPIADSHLADSILLFDRSLAAATDLSSAVRLERAWAYGDMIPDAIVDAVTLCRVNAGTSGEWLDVCTRVGQKFADEGRTWLARSLGLSLQKLMYETSGNDVERERAEAAQDRLRAGLRGQAPDERWVRDEALVRQFLEVLAASNEAAAFGFVNDEWRRRLASGEALPAADCENP